MSFNFGVWYRYDLQGESFNGRTNDDLRYVYLAFRRKTGNAAMNIGRFRVHDTSPAKDQSGVASYYEGRLSFLSTTETPLGPVGMVFRHHNTGFTAGIGPIFWTPPSIYAILFPEIETTNSADDKDEGRSWNFSKPF